MSFSTYDDWKLRSDRDDDWWNEPEPEGNAMTKITLETEDGDYVTSAEVADEPPELIIWNSRYFVSDTFEPGSAGETVVYTEVEPLMLPYAPMEAKPDYGEGEDQ